MDCRTARLLLDFHRPRAGELPAEEAVELERHLAGCADCDAAGRALRRLDDHLGPAVRDVPLPDGLRERLLSRLREERSTRLSRRVGWTLRGAAVAAVLLVGTLLWLHFRTPEPVKLDLTRLSQEEGEIDRLKSPESVALRFKEKHHIMMVPPPFDYTSLVDCDVADVQGKRVPRLLFYRDPGPEKGDITRATVYVFSRDQFDLDALEALNGSPVDDFSQPAQVWRRADDQDTAYLILFRGDLNWVLAGRPH
jgi:Putative zinc-finger